MSLRPCSAPLLAAGLALMAAGCPDDSDLPGLGTADARSGAREPPSAPRVSSLFVQSPGAVVPAALDIVSAAARLMCGHCMQALPIDLDGTPPLDAVVHGALPSTTCPTSATARATDLAGWAVLRGTPEGLEVLNQFEVEADCRARSVVRACGVRLDGRTRGVAIRISRGGSIGGPGTVVIGRIRGERWAELARYDCGSPEDSSDVAGLEAGLLRCLDGVADVDGDGGTDIVRLSPVLGTESRAWASVRRWNGRERTYDSELRCGAVTLEPTRLPPGGPATVHCLDEAPSIAVRQCQPLPSRQAR